MTAEIWAKARELFEARSYKSTPVWDQLGDVTRSVYYDRAEALLLGDFA